MIGLELGVYLEPEMCKLFRWIVINPETYKMWTFVFSVYISSDTLKQSSGSGCFVRIRIRRFCSDADPGILFGSGSGCFIRIQIQIFLKPGYNFCERSDSDQYWSEMVSVHLLVLLFSLWIVHQTPFYSRVRFG